MAIKLNISQKDGKSVQKELSEEESLVLQGKKIGETLEGDALGYPGYKFKISGGSDKSGFPMRKDNSGTARKRILTVGGVIGVKRSREGMKSRKLVAGNTVSENTAQLNVFVEKAGKAPLFEKPETKDEESTGATESTEKANA
ncbi:MAG: S6e family ribosomal protein [Candidatus Woesearchaeota archaeon]